MFYAMVDNNQCLKITTKRSNDRVFVSNSRPNTMIVDTSYILSTDDDGDNAIYAPDYKFFEALLTSVCFTEFCP